MWVLDYKEHWVPKNLYFWTVVFEKPLESPLDCKEFQPVYSKGNQSWIFIARTDAEAETLIIWPPDVKNWLIAKKKKKPWCWEKLKAGGEWDERGWDGWIASLTRWTWVWVSSGSYWWSGNPRLLQSMRSQRVRHNWATELSWTQHSTSQTTFNAKATPRKVDWAGVSLSWKLSLLLSLSFRFKGLVNKISHSLHKINNTFL